MRCSTLLAGLLVLGTGGASLAACPDTNPADGLCDVAVLRVRLTRNLGTGSFPRGKISIEGEFLTDPGAGDVFDAAAGIEIRVTDGDTVDQTLVWTPAECETTRSGRLRCTNATGYKAVFAPLKLTPSLFHFRLKAAKMDIGFQQPFHPPVTVRIEHGGGIVRQGDVDECKNSSKGMNCRHL